MNDVLVAAEAQYGIFTRVDALRCGVTDRQLSRALTIGSIERCFKGVYRVVGSTRSARQRAMAACLYAGERSVLSHQTAGVLLRLDGVRSSGLHITAPTSTRRATSEFTLHRSVDLGLIDRTEVDGLPCTTATRTIIDLAATLHEEALEVAFESARRLGLTAPHALARRAEELCGSGRPGSAKVRDLLRVLEHRPLESRLEVKAARLLRAHDLRPPTNQYVVGAYRLDYAWPAQLLGLECDGFEHHGRRLVWKRDRRRIAALEAAGWRLIHVTWEDVTRHPAETIARLRLALQRVA